MTKDNAQKQAIRARMAKTGERYTTARHYLLDLHRQEQANADVDRSSFGDEELDSIRSHLLLRRSLRTPRRWFVKPHRPRQKRRCHRGWPNRASAMLPSNVPPARAGTNGSPCSMRGMERRTTTPKSLATSTRRTASTAGGRRASPLAMSVPAACAPSTSGQTASRGTPARRSLSRSSDSSRRSWSHDERERWLEGVELRNRTSQPHKSARFDVLPGRDSARRHLCRQRAAEISRPTPARSPWQRRGGRPLESALEGAACRLAAFLGEEPSRP